MGKRHHYRRASAAAAAAASGVALSLLAALPGAAWAQESPAPPPPPQPEQQQAQTPPAGGENAGNAAVSPEDIALFKRAVDAVRRNPVMHVVSEVTIGASGEGAQFSYTERLDVTTKLPGKFRSEITMLNPDGKPGPKIILVADGQKVWTYRPGLKQYSVVTLAQFSKTSDDLPALALLCGIVGSLKSDKDDITDPASWDRRGTTMTVTNETVQETPYRLFTLKAVKEGYTFRFHVDPATGLIRRVSLGGKENGMDFSVTETVERQEAVAAPDPSLFRFTPPRGTKKVAKVAVGPF